MTSGSFTAQVTKPTPNSFLGMGFALRDGTVKVTKLLPSSPFRGTSLQAGDEILSINGTPVYGMSLPAIKALLDSIQVTITIDAKPPSNSKLFEMSFTNADATQVPPRLADVGLSQAKWARICNALSNDLYPATVHSDQMDCRYQYTILDYAGAQRTKGSHERRVFMMNHQANVLQTNCTLVAANLLSLSNALLNPLGILAQVTYQKKLLPKWSEKKQGAADVSLKPKGLEFLLIEPRRDTTVSQLPVEL